MKRSPERASRRDRTVYITGTGLFDAPKRKTAAAVPVTLKRFRSEKRVGGRDGLVL